MLAIIASILVVQMHFLLLVLDTLVDATSRLDQSSNTRNREIADQLLLQQQIGLFCFLDSFSSFSN